MRAAAERAAQQEAGKHSKDKGIEQTLYGMDVTEMLPRLDAREQTAKAKQDASRQKQAEIGEARAAKKKATKKKTNRSGKGARR